MVCRHCKSPHHLYALVERTEARPVKVIQINGQAWTSDRSDADGWSVSARTSGYYCGGCNQDTEPIEIE